MDVRKRGENPPLPRSREGNENPYRRQVTMPPAKTTVPANRDGKAGK